MPRYCDVSLPVPLNQVFTYDLPETLRHRVQRGCRLLVPFGTRKLTGIVLRVYDEQPQVETKLALQLLGEEPALDDELLSLAGWIANYYCTPLGEVLRSMTPLSSEVRKGKIWTLTDSGRDVARQLSIGVADDDPAVTILALLEPRAMSETYLSKKVKDAVKVLRSLQRRGFAEVEDVAAERDPMRAPAEKLLVEFVSRGEGEKLRKAERELIAFLELHPGAHNLGEVDALVKNASVSARALARRGLARLQPVNTVHFSGGFKAPHDMNPHQQAALDSITQAMRAREFQTFLLE
jgi:primosomal protein N' (replication factor Y)